MVMDDDSKRLPTLMNILHLTDFSACSDAAFRWAIALARANQAKLSVLHVVVPDALTSPTALDIQENGARGKMQKVDEQLTSLPHGAIVTRGADVWTAVQKELQELQSELIVLGTHGRTGFTKLLLGSVAEQVLRHSPVPVMSVGPGVAQGPEADGKFHRVLLATDFSLGSAAEYALSLAQRDQAELVLLHVCKTGKKSKSTKFTELSVAEALHRLHELVRQAGTLLDHAETLVEFGNAGTQILEVARRKKADLIVMGVRKARSLFTATHLEIGTTHSVVAQASCPVLTVRSTLRQPAGSARSWEEDHENDKASPPCETGRQEKALAVDCADKHQQTSHQYVGTLGLRNVAEEP